MKDCARKWIVAKASLIALAFVFGLGGLLTLLPSGPAMAAEQPVKILLIRNSATYWAYTARALNQLRLPYDITNTTNLANIDLFQYGQVIIGAAQAQSFYDAITNNRERFRDYVERGGVLEVHGHSGVGSGVMTLPGGVSRSSGRYWSVYNYIRARSHPIVAGVRSKFYGNHASKFWWVNPRGTTIIVNKRGQATTIEYKLGAGTVIATTSPVEWKAHHYGLCNHEFGCLLRNMIKYGYSVAGGNADILGQGGDTLTPLTPIDGSAPGLPAIPFPYGASPITVTPYPPTVGQQAFLGVVLQNRTAQPAGVVKIDFSISGYGLGRRWEPVGTIRDVTIPAATSVNGRLIPGTIHPTLAWTPPFSGHHCVMATITYADGRVQRSQRNIDILGFSNGNPNTDGGPNTTTFEVGNPTDSDAVIELRIVPVVQQPEGWQAYLSETTIPLTPDAFTHIDLTITPPEGAPIGSYATFNVEGYIGDTLIGGISKTVIVGDTMPAPVIDEWFATPNGYFFIGTTLPFARIDIVADGQVFTTTADANGEWSLEAAGTRFEIIASIGGYFSEPVVIVPLSIESPVPPLGIWTQPDLPVFGLAPANGTVDLYVHNPHTGETLLWTSVTAEPDGTWSALVEGIFDGLPEIWIEVEGHQSNSIQVTTDSHPPVVSISVPQPGEAGWYTAQCVAVTLSAEDPPHGTGVDYIEYTLDEGQSWHTYTNGAQVCGDGIHPLQFRAADVAGNLSETGSVEISIDTVPPTTSVALAGQLGDNGWYRSEVTVSLTAVDNLSGVAGIDYSLDGGASWVTYGTPFTLAQDGVHAVRYRSRDVAGNQSTGETEVRIDTQPPLLTIHGATEYTVDQQVSVTCEASDSLSGLAVDPCVTPLVDAPAYELAVGSTEVSAEAVDNAGNRTLATAIYSVRVTADSIGTLIDQFISNRGIGRSLYQRMVNAERAAERGDLDNWRHHLESFIDKVRAEADRGRFITTADADILIRLVEGLLREGPQ